MSRRKKSLPALYAGLQILVAAVIVWVIQRAEPAGWRKRDWRNLGAGMAFMAFDEVFRVHERFSDPMRSLLGHGDLGPFTYAWVVPAIVLVAVLALYFVRFLVSLPAKTRLLFGLAGAIYVGGALGMEMIGGWYWSQYGASSVQSMLVVVEELMEFFGITLFIYAALRYIERERGSAELVFGR